MPDRHHTPEASPAANATDVVSERAPKLTERIVADLLRARHSGTGNGGSGEHAFFTQVRNGAGFDSNRTFDAVALNLWPSRGLALHVFEIKVSRSDWLRELKEPAKAEAACTVADHFWITAPAGCVKTGELPDPWGLIEITGNGADKPWKLRTTKPAPKLHTTPTKTKPIDRALLVSLLRSTPGAVPGGRLPGVDDKALEDARTEGYSRGHRDGQRIGAQVGRQLQQTADDVTHLLDKLRQSGVDRPSLWSLATAAPQIAAALAGHEVTLQVDAVRRTLTYALEALPGGAA